MTSQQTVYLIKELVKHPLSAKVGFLLALSLKGIYFHSKLFKLTLVCFQCDSKLSEILLPWHVLFPSAGEISS